MSVLGVCQALFPVSSKYFCGFLKHFCNLIVLIVYLHFKSKSVGLKKIL